MRFLTSLSEKYVKVQQKVNFYIDSLKRLARFCKILRKLLGKVESMCGSVSGSDARELLTEWDAKYPSAFTSPISTPKLLANLLTAITATPGSVIKKPYNKLSAAIYSNLMARCKSQSDKILSGYMDLLRAKSLLE
jgi:hypothetical protein